MTIEHLSRYRTICVELNEIKSELRELESIDAVQTASKFPYRKHTVPVYGLPSGSDIKKLRQQEAFLKLEKQSIENYIRKIADRNMRYILYQKFIKGKTNLNIAMKLGYTDETVIRRKIKKYFEKAEKADFGVL